MATSATQQNIATMSTPQPDLYISADVETDGPIPGPYSMLSFGLAVVGSYDGHHLDRRPPGGQTYYRELRPISDRFQEEALAVNGLDRDRLIEHGMAPEQAMEEATQWVRRHAGDHKAVLVAYPVAFDWSFLYWYFECFAASGSPFGFSSCLDIRTLYQASAGTVHAASGQRAMPASCFRPPRTPTTPSTMRSSRASSSPTCSNGQPAVGTRPAIPAVSPQQHRPGLPAAWGPPAELDPIARGMRKPAEIGVKQGPRRSRR